jgi:hypothetical protein
MYIRSVKALLLAALAASAGGSPRVEIRVDPRTELISVLHLLAEPKDGRSPRVTLNGLAYGRTTLERFKPFKGHPAVESYRRALAAGAELSQLLHVAVTLLPEKFASGAEPGRLDEKAIGYDRAAVNRLLVDAAAFAREAGLDAHMAESSARHARWRRSVERPLAAADPFKPIEDYTRLESRARITVFLCPFLERTTSITQCGGADCSVLSFWGAERSSRGEPDFAYAERLPVLWHEIAHTLLDDMVDRHKSAFSNRREPDCYGSAARCAREHAAQGLANRLIGWSGARSPRIETQVLRRLDAVEKSLGDYEKKRAGLRSIADFFPQLVQSL